MSDIDPEMELFAKINVGFRLIVSDPGRDDLVGVRVACFENDDWLANVLVALDALQLHSILPEHVIGRVSK